MAGPFPLFSPLGGFAGDLDPGKMQTFFIPKKTLAIPAKIVYNNFAIRKSKQQLERAAGHTEVRVLRDGTP